MPTDTSELSVPHPPEGPPCGPSGPTLERQEMRYVPGKPPHREAILAVRVRNPLASPVWLLYDVGGRLPSAVNAVSVSRTSPAPGAHVWSFEGDGGFQAVRLPPGADLVLRDLELSSYSTDDPFVLAFATSLTIGDRPAESWAGQAGLSPPSGDFRLTSLVPEFERNVDDTAAEPLAARILCVTRFPAGPGGPGTGAQALTERPITGQKARLFGLSIPEGQARSIIHVSSDRTLGQDELERAARRVGRDLPSAGRWGR